MDARGWICCSLAMGSLIWMGADARAQAVADTAAEGQANQEATLSDFVRLELDIDDQPTALQTSVARFVPASGDPGLRWDLIEWTDNL